jgi:alpha-tubulin suppressor-like RCC1 family protein
MTRTAIEPKGRLGVAWTSSFVGATLLHFAAAMAVGCSSEFRAIDPPSAEGGSDAPTTSDAKGIDAARADTGDAGAARPEGGDAQTSDTHDGQPRDEGSRPGVDGGSDRNVSADTPLRDAPADAPLHDAFADAPPLDVSADAPLRDVFADAPPPDLSVDATPQDGASADARPLSVTAIAVGVGHVCALIDNGAIKCWGENNDGELGLGDIANRGHSLSHMGNNLPTVNLGAALTAKLVVGGFSSTCALLIDGGLKCWGYNYNGQLGLGDMMTRGVTPGEMGDNLPRVNLGSGRTATLVDLGGAHACALLDNGAVKCWGGNSNGQLGLGDTRDRGGAPSDMGDALPAVSLGTGRTAKMIATGQIHTCALLDNGTIKCWGLNDSGTLGIGDTARRGDNANEMGDSLPAVNVGTGRTVQSIATGAFHTCVVLDSGAVKCWGNNANAQLGIGNSTDRGANQIEMGDNLPVVNLGTGRSAKSIAAGGFHTCALLDNDTVKCWGNNTQGELGLGDVTTRGGSPNTIGDHLPPVDLGTSRVAKLLALGSSFSCALIDNGAVKCWGFNNAGQLGLGDVSNRGDMPNEMGDRLPVVNIVGN